MAYLFKKVSKSNRFERKFATKLKQKKEVHSLQATVPPFLLYNKFLQLELF
jgi:hypothetical protein